MSEDRPSTRFSVMRCGHICAGPTVSSESWVSRASGKCCRCEAEDDDRLERTGWCTSCQNSPAGA